MDIQIRHLEATDSHDIFDIYRRPSVSENTSQKPYLSSDQVERLFGHSDHFTLVAELSEKVVGHITLFMTTKVRDRHCAGLGIAIHPEAQGKGIGKALMQEVVNQADNWLNLVRLELEVHADNHSAIALYERVGFQLEGTKRLSTFKAGKYIDMLLMSRIRPDLR
ncbi:GNAT family N-acetyltransferase [Vibrio splendidus]|uniref:GNAT family N-acetyltransferase n=1 Tax=Vibrio splendidus TaxID=29497 RepID=UPI0007F960FF|nr:GNAT family N-acetyltransferase [Vibrio splendidus]OBT30752.1 acetyltransferase [Vibrio splendidus]